jgi:putative membrane protein
VTGPASTDPAARGYRRLSPLTPVVRAPIVLVAVVGASWQSLLDQRVGAMGLILLGLLVAGAIYGVASWVRTKYWIADDELRIDTGVVVRQSRRIRIDRLQGIDIVQPLVARIFGLAELRFDVASGSDREGSLAFLPHSEALRLRSLLLERRDDLRGVEREPGVPAQPSPERRLATLRPGPLIGSLVLSTETLLLLLSGVVMGAVFLVTGAFVVAGGVLPAVVGLTFSLGKKLTSYYGFTLSESTAGLHVRRGLTSLSSQTITPARIQGLVVSEPWLWRPFGWAKLDVSVAGYRVTDVDQVQASSTVMPVAPRAEIHALLRHVLGGRDITAVPMSAPPRRARWLAPFTAWTMAFGQDPELLVSRRGFFVRRLDVVPQARVQSVRVTQTPLQGRLGVADVRVDSPPGPVGVVGRLRDETQARTELWRAVELGGAARRRLTAPTVLGPQPVVESSPPETIQ